MSKPFKKPLVILLIALMLISALAPYMATNTVVKADEQETSEEVVVISEEVTSEDSPEMEVANAPPEVSVAPEESISVSEASVEESEEVEAPKEEAPVEELKEESKQEDPKEEPKTDDSKEEPKEDSKEESKDDPKTETLKDDPKTEEPKDDPKEEVKDDSKEDSKVEESNPVEEPKEDSKAEEPKEEEPQEEVKEETPTEDPKDDSKEEPQTEEVEKPQEETPEVKEEAPTEVKEEPKTETPVETPSEDTSKEADSKTDVSQEPVKEEVKEETKEEVKDTEKVSNSLQGVSDGITTYVPVMKIFKPVDGSILAYPLVKEALLTYGFGPRTSFKTDNGAMASSNHEGIDLAIAQGSPIIAAEKGTVIRASWYSGYGNCVEIDHGDGMVTRYAHMSQINVKVGQEVERGQQIGLVGATGNAAGAHLHFEVLINGTAVDPIPYLEIAGAVPNLSFASKRLLVKIDNEEALKDEPVVAHLDDIYILQYETEDEAKKAYITLTKEAEFIEVDSGISIAEGSQEAVVSDTMDEEVNAFTAAQGEIKATYNVGQFDVALIDTGALENTEYKMTMFPNDDGIDRLNHGQRMADIITMLNPDVKIFSIKAIDDSGVGEISAVYAAIKVAIEKEVKIINLSISALKTEDSKLIEEAIMEARARGIIVVGAAGNNGIDAKLTIPGYIDEVIVAGAGKGNASNYGSTVDYIVPVNSTSVAAAVVTGLISKGETNLDFKDIPDDMDEALEAAYPNRYFTPQDTVNLYVSNYGGSPWAWSTSYGGHSFYVYCQNHGYWAAANSTYSFSHWTETVTVDGRRYERHYFSRPATTTSSVSGLMNPAYGNEAASAAYSLNSARSAYITAINSWFANHPNYEQDEHWHQQMERATASELAAYQNAKAYLDTFGGSVNYFAGEYDTVYVGSYNVQGMYGYYDVPLDVDLTLKKSASNTAFTEGNSNYSLVGTQYGLYSDSACSNRIGTFTVSDEDGNTNTITITEPGTYYYKEIKAGKGYVLDDTVGSITISNSDFGGGAKTINVADKPVGDPERIQIQKVKTESNGETKTHAIPELTDRDKAVFKVEFFGNDNWSGDALRTWYYATKDGVVRFDNATYLASGYNSDDLYRNNSRVEWPIGTIRISEERAPYGLKETGYAQDIKITQKSAGSNEVVITYSDPKNARLVQFESDGTPTIINPQILGGVYIEKEDKSLKNKPAGNADLTGIEFEVVYAPRANGEADTERSIVIGDTTFKYGDVVANASGTDANGRTIRKIAKSQKGVTDYSNGKEVYYTMLSGNKLPAGRYIIREISTNGSYQLIDGGNKAFTVSEDGVVVTVDNSGNPLKAENIPNQGTVTIEKKLELSDGTKNADVDVTGVRFAVINKSTNSIVINRDTNSEQEIAPNRIADILTIGSDGKASSNNKLDYGTYQVIELKANATAKVGDPLNSDNRGSGDYANDKGVLYKGESQEKDVVKNGENYTFDIVTNKEAESYIKITKKSNETLDPQGDASLAGIKFAIVNDSTTTATLSNGTSAGVGKVVAIVPTNASGVATSPKLPFGTYTVYELRSDATIAVGDTYSGSSKLGSSIYANNAGYLYKANSQKIVAHENGKTYECDFTNNIVRGGVKIEKWDTELNRKAAQGDADFAGIKFEITNKSKAPVIVNGTTYPVGAVVYTMTTNAAGDASTSNNLLPYGTYEIKEVATNGKYLLSDTVAKTFEIRENNVIVSKDTAGNSLAGKVFKDTAIRGGVKLQKIDSETNKNEPQGWGSLEAKVAIYNNSDKLVKVDGKEIAPGKVIREVTLDKNGSYTTGAKDLPYGTYYAVEVKESEGYNPNTAWRVDFRIREDGKIVDTTSASSKISESENTKSGWFKVTGKIDGPDSNQASMEQLPIRGDASWFKVDIDGKKMGNIPFLISRLDRNGKVVESHVIVSDSEGRLDTATRPKTGAKVNSLDSYVKDGVFTDESKLNEVTGVWFGEQSARDNNRGSLIYANYIIEELQCEENKGHDLLKQYLLTDDSKIKEIFTEGHQFPLDNIFVNLIIHPKSDFIDETSKTKIASKLVDAKMTDSVDWDHLKIGQKYKLKTEVWHEDNDGKKTLLGESTVEFTPSKVDKTNTSYGTEINSVTVNTKNLKNGKLHAVDYIYAVVDGNDVLIASHNREMDTDNQIIEIPEIKTFASDITTGDRVGTLSKTKIKDIVEYKNLAPDKMYRLEGKLIDRETGEQIGETVTKTLRINYNVTGMEEKAHWIVGPKNGTVIMPEIEVDGEEFIGKTLVIVEHLYDDDTNLLIADHEELLDEDQSIHWIEVGTKAFDMETGTHTGTVSENDKVIDKVEVKNTVKDAEYVIKGQFIRKDTMEVISTSETTFTAKTDGGTEIIDLEFDVDSSELAGISCVAYEYLYHNDVGVGKHEDPDDEDQIVNYPEVRTTAKDGLTGTHAGVVGDEATIIDTVELKNLTVGDKYMIIGTLMNNDGTKYSEVVREEPTDEPIDEPVDEPMDEPADEPSDEPTEEPVDEPSDEPSDEPTDEPSDEPTDEPTDEPSEEPTETKDFVVMSEVFTATEKDMTKDLEFKFSSKDLKGKSLVVFEKLIFIGDDEPALDEEGNPILDEEGNPVIEPKEVEVANHEDPTDPGQTVSYPDGRTNATDSKTKDHVGTVGGTEIVQDEVTFSNLVIGEKYTITGDLHYTEDSTDRNGVSHKAGDQVLNKDGEPYTATTGEFVAETSDGSKILTYEVDSRDLEGATIVVFEDFYSGKVKVFSHADITDEKQTVYYPEVKTTLLSKKTGDHVGDNDKKTVMVDTVSLKNLVVGETYTVQGTLMDLDTKAPIKNADGSDVKSEPKEFEATSTEMTLEIEFTLDGEERENKTTVAFEELIHNGVVVNAHADFGDKDQTVWTPDVITKAKDAETDANIGRPREETIIIDEITLTNLIVGREYTVTGYLMDQATGERYIDADGNEVQGEPITFIAEKATEVKEMTFTFNGSNLKGKTVTVFEDLYHNDVMVGSHHDINSTPQSVDYPDGRTEAKDAKTLTKSVLGEEKAEVIDTFYYENLNTEYEYTIKAKLVDKADPTTVVAEKTIENWKPEAKSGSVEIKFEFDARELLGKSLVAFETVLYKDVELIVHENPDDEDQTVYIPKIGTVAKDKADNDNIIVAKKNQTIVDTVAYENLEPNKTYEAVLTIFDKTANKVIEGIEIRKSFTASETGTGEVDVEVKVNGEELAGHVLVMFEEVYRVPGKDEKFDKPETPVGEHKKPDAPEQTIYVPKIGTTARDKADGDQFIISEKNQVIVDTVAYEGLEPNSKNIAVLTIFDKTDNKEIEGIVIRQPFTASETGTGTVDVEVKVNGKELAGHILVMFEEVYKAPETGNKPGPNDTPIAEHKDPKDNDQTIYVPKIGTVAKDKADGDHYILNAKDQTIVDTVMYEGLMPNAKFEARLTVFDQTMGKVIEGIEIRKEFTASKTGTGEVEVEVTLDGTKYAGHKLVMFEEVYKAPGKGEKTPDKPVGEHKNPKDPEQTIYVPKAGTTLKADGKKEVTAKDKIDFTDTVKYEGLEKGKEYTLTGELVRKDTKEVIAKAEMTFIAKASSGKVEMVFKDVDTSKLAGKSVVAFETISYTDPETKANYIVAEHKDLNDKDQTVVIKAPEPPIKTGDETKVMPYISLMTCALLLAAAIMMRRRMAR